LPDFDTYKIEALAAPPLTLEPLACTHAAALFAELSNPALYEFRPQDPPSMDELEQRFQRWEKTRSPSGDALWLNWVARLESGAVGLLQATCTRDREALIAYEIFLPFQRRGLAAKAVALMLAHLERAAGMTKARALVDTRNERSIRLLERLGFAKKRLIADADYFKGATSHEFEYELDLKTPPNL
jgi:[ribosomal protein S5]-alanine N-acetyltransferase